MTDSDGISPWDVLGVSPLDEPDEIRKAWRALVRSYHPDMARTDREAANQRLAEINAAFDAISNRESAMRMAAELRRAEAARREEANRRAEIRRRAQANREAENARAVQRERADRAARMDATRSPAIRPQSWSQGDLLASRAARLAFERALRIFNGTPGSDRPAVFL